jgi:hypothetical protein
MIFFVSDTPTAVERRMINIFGNCILNDEEKINRLNIPNDSVFASDYVFP